MTIATPLSWIKQTREGAAACQKIPLWGSPPAFPSDKLCDILKKELAVEDFGFSVSGTGLLEPENFLTPFGSHPKLVFLQLSPLSGYLVWILSEESIKEMTALLLNRQGTKGTFDAKIQEGFYEFLILETIREIGNLKTYPGLQLLLLEEKKLPEADCLGTDISISLEGRSFPARLLLSPECSLGFTEHFAQKTFDCKSAASFSSIDIPLSLEVGSCLLEQSEWAEIKKGDFLILDRCSYDPQTDKGTAILSLAEKPCFIVKMKKNGLKILDYAVYHGDLQTMNEKFVSESPEEETPIPVPAEGDANKEDITVEESSELTKEEEQDSKIAITSPPPEVLTSPEKIPFPIVVEIGRIQMSLEKLLQLTPGNILEMQIRPSEGVYLTVHGKKIARGELTKIGEVLGVKILETGDTPVR